MNTYDVIVGGQIQTDVSGSDPKSFERRTEGRFNARKSVGSDKVLGIAASAIANSSLNFALFNASLLAVTVSAGNSSGTSSVTSGWKVLAIFPTTNQDQIVKSVAISGTTLTVTLLANATADNKFNVLVIAP